MLVPGQPLADGWDGLVELPANLGAQDVGQGPQSGIESWPVFRAMPGTPRDIVSTASMWLLWLAV